MRTYLIVYGILISAGIVAAISVINAVQTFIAIHLMF